MIDLLISIFAQCAIVSLTILLLICIKIVTLNIQWAAVAAALLTGYFLVVNGISFITNIYSINSHLNLHWNWIGKTFGVFFWIGALLLLKRFKPTFRIADAGFTWSQNPGSMKPVLTGSILLLLLASLMTQLIGDGIYDTEEIIFQASLPGLDEEPMFRGLLLYCLTLAIPSGRTNIFGARINASGLIITLFFGLAHGLQYDKGDWHFSLIAITTTGLFGLFFLWLRERTGSLIFPILIHNMLNVIVQFRF